MKYLLSLALKNILRYKRRTALTFLILTFGIMIYVMMSGLLKGFNDQSFKNQIAFETGDFKLHSAQFDPEHPTVISNFITNTAAVEAVLAGKPYIRAYTERTIVAGEADNTRFTTPVQIIGINLERENSVFTFSNYISEGSMQAGMAVVGKSLAKDLDLLPGENIYLTFRNRRGIVDSVAVEISGLILSPNPAVNQASVFVDQATLAKWLESDGVTEIALKTENYKNYLSYQADLEKSLPETRIQNWKELGDEFMAISQAKGKSAGLVLFFIAVIAVVGIINTMLMSVYEKKREIGTLKALGMTDRDIKRLFVYEGMLIGLLGSVTGIIAGVLGNLYFVLVGFDLTAIMGGSNVDLGYKVLGSVKSAWDVGSMVGAVVLSFIFSVLASYYPAGKAVKMHAAECLRTI